MTLYAVDGEGRQARRDAHGTFGDGRSHRVGDKGRAEDRGAVVQASGGPVRRSVQLGPGDVVQVVVEEGVEDGERVLLGDLPPEIEAPAGGQPPEDPPRVAGSRR